MYKQYNQSKSFRSLIILAALFCVLLSATSCGPSSEDRQKKRESKGKRFKWEEEANLKMISDQLSERHNAIYFPPKNLQIDAYTYELQKFFENNADRLILFKGYLEDIEKTDRGIVVEFICPLAEMFFINKIAVRFNLTISDAQVKKFVGAKRGELVVKSLRYFLAPDYFVVAKVFDLKKIRRYEFVGSTHEEEVEINVEMPSTFLSTGVLMEAVSIPKDESATSKTP